MQNTGDLEYVRNIHADTQRKGSRITIFVCLFSMSILSAAALAYLKSFTAYGCGQDDVSGLAELAVA